MRGGWGRALGAVCAAFCLLALAACEARSAGRKAGQKEPVVVYSARKEHLIKPVFEMFTARSGIPVRYLTDSAAPLLLRLETEAENTPADLLLTVDAGHLWQAAERGVLQRTDSETLQGNIPAQLRDPRNHWFGLSLRARTIVYAPERVKEWELARVDYADLAAPRWRGRLCLRSGKKVYNLSLTGSLLHHLGEQRTLAVVQGWVRNLGLPPFDSDTRAMEAILAGRCDLTVVNTYYYGRLQRKWSEQGKTLPLAISWPGQRGTGVHVNISGAGITRHAGNPKGARALLEWLAGEQAQQLFASLNLEYPVHPQVPPAPQVRAWGEFTADRLNVAELGRRQAQAARIIDRAGWN